MANKDDDKKEVAASDAVRQFLNMGDEAEYTEVPGPEHSSPADDDTPAASLPPDLPFLDTLEEPNRGYLEDKLQPAPDAPPAPSGPIEQILGPAKAKGNEAYAFVLWLLKSLLPYVVIFAIALGLYFFYFSDFSINSLFKSDALTLENVASNKDLDKLKKDQKDEYAKWIAQFFFKVNDEAIISMDADVSGNGLTNFEKYLLNLNPKVYSSRGTNKPDGELVTENINPWTGKPFSDKQRELVDKYINKETISNRITAAALTRGVTKFAEYVNPGSPYYIEPEALRQIQQNNPAIYSPEQASNQTAYQASQQAIGNANQSPNLNPQTEINLEVPGKLEIPANNLAVPLIWTKDVANFETDLKSGVVHYPGTVLPGQIGTSYISGHSSGYVWDRSPYKQVFAILGQVKDGTSFVITVTQKDGKLVKYHYIVERRGEYAANDQAQFINTADSVVALSTCWPVGTTARRLVLFSKLTQTERL
jgi:sortase A